MESLERGSPAAGPSWPSARSTATSRSTARVPEHTVAARKSLPHKKENVMKPLVAALILMLAAVAPAAPHAAGPGTQRISVPLTDPARPATLKVSRLNGSITVEGYAGKEVLIESSPDGEDSDERPRRGASGMRRIPNLGQGLSVDEDNNVVRVEARNPSHGGDIHIQVPLHCSLHLSAVNGGEIRVSGVEGEIELSH